MEGSASAAEGSPLAEGTSAEGTIKKLSITQSQVESCGKNMIYTHRIHLLWRTWVCVEGEH